MAEPRDNGATRAIPTTKPDNATLARFLAPGFETDTAWNSRSATNKAMRAMDGAIPRLGGLAEICFGLSYREMADGTRSPGDALRSPYYYLGTALQDIAKGLNAAHKLWWDAAEGEDDAPAKAPRKRPARKAGRAGA